MKPKRGRPPLEADKRATIHVNVRLDPHAYDRAYALARAERVTVPALLRRALELMRPKIGDPH